MQYGVLNETQELGKHSFSFFLQISCVGHFWVPLSLHHQWRAQTGMLVETVHNGTQFWDV